MYVYCLLESRLLAFALTHRICPYRYAFCTSKFALSQKDEKMFSQWLWVSNWKQFLLQRQGLPMAFADIIKGKKVKERIRIREIHLRTTGRHLSNGITQCYLLPDRGDRPAFTPTGQVGTRFIDPVRMKGWVSLVGWLHTEMVYPSTDGHPSEY